MQTITEYRSLRLINQNNLINSYADNQTSSAILPRNSILEYQMPNGSILFYTLTVYDGHYIRKVIAIFTRDLKEIEGAFERGYGKDCLKRLSESKIVIQGQLWALMPSVRATLAFDVDKGIFAFLGTSRDFIEPFYFTNEQLEQLKKDRPAPFFKWVQLFRAGAVFDVHAYGMQADGIHSYFEQAQGVGGLMVTSEEYAETYTTNFELFKEGICNRSDILSMLYHKCEVCGQYHDTAFYLSGDIIADMLEYFVDCYYWSSLRTFERQLYCRLSELKEKDKADGIMYRQHTICPQCWYDIQSADMNYIDRYTDLGVCEDCGEILRQEDIYYIETAYGKSVCSSCLDGGNYAPCAHCDRLLPTSEMAYVDSRGCYFCDDCRESENIFACCACGEYFELDDLFSDYTDGGGYCAHCYRNVTHDIMNEDARPYNFVKSSLDTETDACNGKTLYLGAELENEFPDTDNLNSFLDKISSVYYQSEIINDITTDGSLSGPNIELITQPLTLSAHKERFADYESIFEGLWLYADNTRTDSIGLHVHISKTWPKQYDMLHALKLDRLINALLPLCEAVGGRSLTRGYNPIAIYENLKKQKTTCNNRGRNRPFAIREKTVEFRFPKTTSNIESYFAILELCLALYQYSCMLNSSAMYGPNTTDETLLQGFLAYVKEKQASYSHLCKVLKGFPPIPEQHKKAA